MIHVLFCNIYTTAIRAVGFAERRGGVDMKMRKRVLCLLLMMTLCIQSFMPAYAAETGLETEETAVQAEEESTGETELTA